MCMCETRSFVDTQAGRRLFARSAMFTRWQVRPAFVIDEVPTCRTRVAVLLTVFGAKKFALHSLTGDEVNLLGLQLDGSHLETEVGWKRVFCLGFASSSVVFSYVVWQVASSSSSSTRNQQGTELETMEASVQRSWWKSRASPWIRWRLRPRPREGVCHGPRRPMCGVSFVAPFLATYGEGSTSGGSNLDTSRRSARSQNEALKTQLSTMKTKKAQTKEARPKSPNWQDMMAQKAHIGRKAKPKRPK